VKGAVVRMFASIVADLTRRYVCPFVNSCMSTNTHANHPIAVIWWLQLSVIGLAREWPSGNLVEPSGNLDRLI
jgi:hypothetical protein